MRPTFLLVAALFCVGSLAQAPRSHVPPFVPSLANIPAERTKACAAAGGCYVLTHDEIVHHMQRAHAAGQRAATQEGRQ